MKKEIKDRLLFPIIFLIFLFSDLIYLIPSYLFKIDIKSLSNTQLIIINLLIDIILAFIIFLIYHKYLKEKWSDFKKNFNCYFDISLKYWLLGLSVMLIANLILNQFNSDISNNENAVQGLIKNFPIIAFILTTFCAPFIEEMVFRKSLRDMIKNNTLYVILSGLIFGFMHVMNSETLIEYLYIIPYGALGCAFAYTIVKTDNIYSAIMMHMLHNGILTLISIMVIL